MTQQMQAHTLRLRRFGAILLLAMAAAGLPGCDEKDPTGTDLSTSSEGAQAVTPGDANQGDVTVVPADATAALLGTIPLPINQSKATTGVLFGLTQTGTGPAGVFKINNTASFKDALLGQSNGNGGAGARSAAVHGVYIGNGGFAGLFESTGGAFQPALAVKANHKGSAAEIAIANPNNSSEALSALSLGDRSGRPACLSPRMTTRQSWSPIPGSASRLTSEEPAPAPPRAC